MPRKAREKSSTGIYHVMIRGINHQIIFDDQEDYDAFLQIMQRIQQPTNKAGIPLPSPCEIYAYALMGNHFHLLLKVLDNPKPLSVKDRTVELGDIIKRIASAYVLHYNSRHGRDGHLFKERFKSEPCESDDYFKTLMVYIHQNPVSAGITKSVAQYPYTSWHEYIGSISPRLSICNTERALEKVTLEDLKRAIETPMDTSTNCLDYDEKRRLKLSDKYIADYISERYGLEHPTQVQSLSIKDRNNIIQNVLRIGAGVRQLQRVTGVGLFVISRLNSALSSVQDNHQPTQ